MITAREFLEESFQKIEEEAKLNRYYLKVLTFGIDKQFIIDLNKIYVKLIPADKVLTELLEFVTFVTSRQENNDLNYCFTSYLVILLAT